MWVVIDCSTGERQPSYYGTDKRRLEILAGSTESYLEPEPLPWRPDPPGPRHPGRHPVDDDARIEMQAHVDKYIAMREQDPDALPERRHFHGPGFFGL